MRSARALTENVPNPARVTEPSCFSVDVTASITASSARLAEAFEMSAVLAISSISSVLFNYIPLRYVVGFFGGRFVSKAGRSAEGFPAAPIRQVAIIDVKKFTNNTFLNRTSDCEPLSNR